MGNVLDLIDHVGHVSGSQENNLWPHVIRSCLRELAREGAI